MPITDLKTGAVTYAGCVLSIYSELERVMSDVYADVRYALVLGEHGTHAIRLGDNEFGEHHTAVVDATPAVLAVYEAHKVAVEARAKAQAEAQREDDAFERAMKVTAGASVAVVSGRKLPKGTGKVLRTANGGDRALVEMDGSGLTEWTDSTNLNRTDRVLPAGLSWVEYEDTLRVAPLWTPKRGDRVLIPDGREGLLFWEKEGRVGVSPSQVKNPNTGKFDDAVWLFATQVTQPIQF